MELLVGSIEVFNPVFYRIPYCKLVCSIIEPVMKLLDIFAGPKITEINSFEHYRSNLVNKNYSDCQLSAPGGRLNKKDGLTRCGNSHVKDKTS